MNRVSRSRHPRSIGVTLLGVLAGLIFLVSLIVHFITFLPHPTVSMDLVWPIHVAIFIPFGAMLLLLALQKRTPRRSLWQVLKRANEQPNDQADADFDRQARVIERVVHSVPLPVLILGITLLFYTIVNFVIFMGLVGGGSPAEDNGRYYLSNHGNYIRELTEDEYHQYQAYEVRGFSGHWLIFSFVPSAYCLFIHRSARDEEDSDPAP